MGNIGPLEIILIGIVAVLIFGATRIPDMGRTVGKGLRDFKESVGGATDLKDALNTVNDVRSAATPTNLAGAFVPGVRDVQETVTAAKGAVSTEAPAAAEAESAATTAPTD
jgi:sec-independent protein translocase protein TatA